VDISSQVNTRVFPPNSRPYGKTYGKWAEEWIKWALSLPRRANPVADNTGKDCAKMQRGPAWFLAGTFGTSVKRKCAIPSTTAIFFPIIEKECSFAEDGDQLKTEAELIARARYLMDIVLHMEVELDGNSLEDLHKYRAQSKVFNLTFPMDNVYGVKEGITRSVTDGYWIMLKPLRSGNHTIHFSASAQVPADQTATIAYRYVKVEKAIFEIEVFYDLEIF